MLYSQFFVDEDRYVIAAKNIIEIVPYMSLKIVPLLPDYAAGMLNYHGVQLPVIDLCQLLINRPCHKKLSTRIIVIQNAPDAGVSVNLGIMVEKATEMSTIDETLFKQSAMKNPESPVDGMIAISGGVLITKISIENIFEKTDERIFQSVETRPGEMGK